MEAESWRKRKNVEANLEEEDNSLCEKKEEESIQEEFDKLTRKLLLNLKKSRERAIEHVSLWKMNKRDGIDGGSLLECLDLTLYEVDNYLDLKGDYCRGFVQLDPTTAKEEIEKEIKLWEEKFGDLCTTESNAYKEFIDTVIYPKTIACFRKLKKIEGVIDKVKNDPRLGDPWTLDEIDERLMAIWDGIVWDEGSRFKIVRRLINFERWYGQEDASAATAEYTVEKYEDLIREVVELSSYDNGYAIVKLLTDFSTYASFIASALREVLLKMMK